MPDTNIIEVARAKLDGVIAEQYAYPRDVLGKTRRLHPDELLRFTPEHLHERERDARRELFGVLYSERAPLVQSAQRSRYVPDRREARALLDGVVSRTRHYAALRDLGTEFVPASEIAEAWADAETAWQLYQSALAKNSASTCTTCRKPKRRAASDGFVSTGRYRMIDGERVPVVRRAGQ
jgi:hypothetical protein